MNNFLKNVFKSFWHEDFIIDGLFEKNFTYKDFWGAVLNCKKFLEKLGLKKGDRICLLMNNSLDFVVIYFASLLMNLVVVPIDPLKRKVEIELMIKLSCCKNVLCNYDLPDYSFDAINLEKIKDDFYQNLDVDIDSLNLLDDIDFKALHLITFTSGSTGVAKGVMHSFGNLCKSALAFDEFFGFNHKNVFYHNLPMSYMAGILNLIILPLFSGSKIVLGPRFDFSKILNFWNIPIKYAVNTFWFVPTILSLLLKLDRGSQGIEYFRTVNAIGCVGTAPLSVNIKRDFENKYNVKLFQSYGLSETLFVSTNSFLIGDSQDGVGKVLNGAKVFIDKNNEILISTDWMFLGYLDGQSDKLFKSGDLGFVDKKGFLSVTDRIKNLIIRGGVNISPLRIEKFIEGLNCYHECVVLGLRDDVLGEKTTCFYVPKKEFNRDIEKELNSKIYNELGRDYCIDKFVELDSIPKNLNGKVDKLKLKGFLL